jgi:trigger factor
MLTRSTFTGDRKTHKEDTLLKKQISRIAALFCASALSLSLVACGSKSSSESTTLSLGKADDYDYANFSYSQNIGTDGYWEDVHALDYVTLPEDYASVTIQKADVEPSNDDVQEQLDAVLVMDSSTAQVLDRAAVSGDNVNIDYVGSIDGVEFTGGSYSGYTLTLGSGSFIDGFEDQIVGHTPGETFDVTVTFPDGYSDSTDSDRSCQSGSYLRGHAELHRGNRSARSDRRMGRWLFGRKRRHPHGAGAD